MLVVGAIKSRETSPFSPSEYSIEKDFSFAIPNAWPSNNCQQVQSQYREKGKHLNKAELHFEQSRQKKPRWQKFRVFFHLIISSIYYYKYTCNLNQYAKYLNARTCTSSGLTVIGSLVPDQLSRAKIKDDSHILRALCGHIKCLIKWSISLYRRIVFPISAKTSDLPM